MDGVRQRQRGWSSLTEPGLGAAGSAGRPRAPRGRLGSPSAPPAAPAPRVIYDPLPLPGGSSGSGLGPAAEGPERGDREQRQPGHRERGRGFRRREEGLWR